MHLLEQLMRSVIRIEARTANGQVATGSGFAYRFAMRENGLHVPAIVTNKHVIDGAVEISFPVSTADEQGNLTGNFEIIRYPINSDNVLSHPSEDVDLCAIMSGPLYNHFKDRKLQPAIYSLDKKTSATEADFSELLPMEEVTMIGYPNGIWDSTNNGSIARRGIIATTPSDNYLGKKQFVVDMACFPGSSGSPVFLANFGSYADRNGNISVGSRIKLLGVLYAGPQHRANGEIVVVPVPTSNQPVAQTSIPNNLGYVIKALELEPLEEMAEKLLTSESSGPANAGR
ncbi:MAG: S1 family peptidase [Marinobacter adhaerens]|uniref:S1 family peptidase n=1 Tax=Marinobacter adhaerens TaxID=1033846 RepID=UPI003C5A3F83